MSRKLNQGLSLGKLARALVKSKKKLTPCDDKLSLGTLTVVFRDDPVVFDVRDFKFDRKKYKLIIFGINDTAFSGCSEIKVDPKNVKKMTFSEKY